MSNIIEPKSLPGVMELLPKNQVLMNKVTDVIRKNYERFGFLPLDTPIIENADVLLAKAGGETEKQIYKFKKGENDIALRFDLTVPLAKYVAANYNDLVFPFRRYQIGKVYRGEKPQKGRFREFYQCDIDIIGDEVLDVRYDAEFPMIIYNIFKELNLGDFTIYYSNRKLLNGYLKELNLFDRKDEIFKYIDKYEKIGRENVQLTLLEDVKLPEDKVNSIFKLIEISGTNTEKINALKQLNINNEEFQRGIEELEIVNSSAVMSGLPEENFQINLTIIRGLDYYTGTVYETFLNDYRGIGSICSGGRFDNLAGFYTDRKLPGVGISIGLTRLFYQLLEKNILKNNESSVSKVLILPFDKNAYDFAYEVANEVRKNSVNCEIYLNSAKLKTMLNYANKQSVPFVVIIGETELKENKVLLKDMSTGEQSLLTKSELLNLLKNNCYTFTEH